MRYKEGERDGKGKEYDIYSNTMLFEGEYLNGKRNGIGKEYDCNNKLIYIGLYLSNKKWSGKAYDENDNIVYEIIN